MEGATAAAAAGAAAVCAHRSFRDGKLPRCSQAVGKLPLRPMPLSQRVWRLGKPAAQLSGNRLAAASPGGAGPGAAAAAGLGLAAAVDLTFTAAVWLGLGGAMTSLASPGKPWDQLAGSGRATCASMVSVRSAGNTPRWPQLGGSRSGGCCWSACRSKYCSACSAPARRGGSGSGVVNPNTSTISLQGQAAEASGCACHGAITPASPS